MRERDSHQLSWIDLHSRSSQFTSAVMTTLRCWSLLWLLLAMVPLALLGCADDEPTEPTPDRVWRIAFTSDREGSSQLYSIRSDGTGIQRVSFSTGVVASPRWSPSEEEIAFSDISATGLEANIYVAPLDSSGGTDITKGSGTFNLEPSWSPGGGMLAFATNRDDNFEVYVMKSDGTGVRNLSAHAESDHAPLWSPDDSLIAFLSARDSTTEIYVVHPDGSGLRRLTNNSDEEIQLAWSPSGSHIAYRRGGDIYRVGKSGGAEMRLTDDSIVEGDPAWSPDGERIVYAAADGLHIMNADGSGKKWIENSTGDDHMPAWSPDGRLIAFLRLGADPEIYVMSPEGQNSTNVSQDPATDWEPTWER
jgi:Tol biopolymer transport system component